MTDTLDGWIDAYELTQRQPIDLSPWRSRLRCSDKIKSRTHTHL